MILPSFYDFCCRVKIVSGHKALEKLPTLLAAMHASRPMIITDKGIVGAGLIGVLKKAMGTKIKIGAIYDNVPVDSEYKIVDDAVKVYRRKKCDSIIAVGGGSTIDTAKGVNIVVSLGGNTLLDYEGYGTVNKKLNPMVVIPTTGSGSEVTVAAVISDHDRKIKMLFPSYFLLPDVAVIDPRMTKTQPPHFTVATVMDALTHACEAYIGKEKNPLSDSYAISSIRMISKNLMKVIQNPNDMEARYALGNATTIAGVAFSNSMVGLVHNLAHTIGAMCGIPHGVANSIILPYGLEYNIHRNSDIIGELLFPLAGTDVYLSTKKKDRPMKAVEYIRKMNKDLRDATDGRHPTCLKEIVDRNGKQLLQQSVLPIVAKGVMLDGCRMYNPEEILPDDALMIFEHAWDGSPLDRKKIKKGGNKVKY